MKSIGKKILSTLILSVLIWQVVLPVISNVEIKATDENKWDVSKNQDGSVIAVLDDEGTLTISGEGEMRDWNYDNSDVKTWHSLITDITDVNIEDGITSIGARAFMNCTKIKEIKLPSTLISIGEYAFCNCNNLEIIEINSYIKLGSSAFSRCDKLNSLKIGKDAKDFNPFFFTELELENVEVNSENKYLKYLDGVLYNYDFTKLIGCCRKKEGIVNINNNVRIIRDGSFQGCTEIKEINMSDSVEIIERYAFVNCKKLESIKLSKSIKKIEKGMFWNCDNLKEIVIPESVTNIEDEAFYSCDSLTNIKIPSSVLNIGNYVFNRCRSLTSLDVSDDNKNYSSIDGVLFNKNVTTLIKYPGNRNGFKYEIPENIYKLETYAFEDSCNLTNIEIPSSVTSIGFATFENCSSLTSIDVSNNNKNYCSVDGVLFDKGKVKLIKYKKKKQDVLYKIPSSVTSIESRAFQGCSNLTSIKIPSIVTSIGIWTFEGCNSSLTIYTKDNTTAKQYAIDNKINYKLEIAPTMTVTKPETQRVKNANIKIEVSDNAGGCGLSEGNTYKYYLSSSETQLQDGKWLAYKSGSRFTIGEQKNGEYWLFIKKVYDKLGNYSNTNVTVGEEEYLRVGPYKFDNEGPKATITVDTSKFTEDRSLIYTINFDEYLANKPLALRDIEITNGEKGEFKEIDYRRKYTLEVKNVEEGEQKIQIKAGSVMDQLINYNKIIEKTVEVNIQNIDKVPLKTNIKYNTTNITNKDVTATIIANKEIQPVEGWTLSQDKKVLTKKYSKNTRETIIVLDLAGNETEKEVNIQNIDKVAPQASVKYGPEGKTNGNVTVTLTSNEELQPKENWTLSEDKKTLTRVYTDNIEGLSIVKDLAGNETTVEIIVANIDRIAPTASVEYERTTRNVTATITANEAIQEIEGWTLSEDKKVLTKKYSKNTKETVTIKDLAGNESTIKVEITNIIDIVPGDFNGDGVVDVTDVSILRKHIISGNKADWKITDEELLKEADINKDGVIDVTDVQLLRSIILKSLK